jgi:UDP-glucose 4,6-dehydratase
MEKYIPKNILITGGCGFIASNFINYMVKKYIQYNFYNIDAMYYCADINNITVHNYINYKFIKGNICSSDLITYILHEYNIDTIIHFAAQSHVENSFSNSLQYTQDNILGTHNLLEMSRIYGKIKRFIHVSTDEVYGESMLEQATKKHEESVLCPTNPYAATKAAAELIAMSYYHSFKMPIIVTRGNNVFGERQYPEKLIPRFINLLLNNQKLTIQGDGSCIRAFIYVPDVVHAFDNIINQGEIGEIYNIGSDDNYEYSIMDIAKILLKKLKPDEEIDNWIEYIKDREFNDKRYYISNQKIKNLGWKQEYSFEEGLTNTINYHLNTHKTQKNNVD